MAAKNSNSFGNLIKTGFGLTAGSWLFMIIAIAVAMLFFIPGFILVQRENKKENEGGESSQGAKIAGFVLMGIGMIVGLGFGSSTFFSLLSNEL